MKNPSVKDAIKLVSKSIKFVSPLLNSEFNGSLDVKRDSNGKIESLKVNMDLHNLNSRNHESK
jgi:hypothetical protein